MSSNFKPRERYRHIAIAVYMAFLALMVPLTVFVVQQENKVRTQAATPASSENGVNPAVPSIVPSP